MIILRAGNRVIDFCRNEACAARASRFASTPRRNLKETKDIHEDSKELSLVPVAKSGSPKEKSRLIFHGLFLRFSVGKNSNGVTCFE